MTAAGDAAMTYLNIQSLGVKGLVKKTAKDTGKQLGKAVLDAHVNKKSIKNIHFKILSEICLMCLNILTENVLHNVKVLYLYHFSNKWCFLKLKLIEIMMFKTDTF